MEKLGDATVGHGFGWPGKLEKTGTDGRPHRAIVVASGCDRFGARSDTAR